MMSLLDVCKYIGWRIAKDQRLENFYVYQLGLDVYFGEIPVMFNSVIDYYHLEFDFDGDEYNPEALNIALFDISFDDLGLMIELLGYEETLQNIIDRFLEPLKIEYLDFLEYNVPYLDRYDYWISEAVIYPIHLAHPPYVLDGSS